MVSRNAVQKAGATSSAARRLIRNNTAPRSIIRRSPRAAYPNCISFRFVTSRARLAESGTFSPPKKPCAGPRLTASIARREPRAADSVKSTMPTAAGACTDLHKSVDRVCTPLGQDSSLASVLFVRPRPHVRSARRRFAARNAQLGEVSHRGRPEISHSLART